MFLRHQTLADEREVSHIGYRLKNWQRSSYITTDTGNAPRILTEIEIALTEIAWAGLLEE